MRTDIFVAVTAALSTEGSFVPTSDISFSSSQIGHGPGSNHCRNKKPYDHTIHRGRRTTTTGHGAIKVRYCREKKQSKKKEQRQVIYCRYC